MIDETLLEAEEKMEKAVTVAKEDFASIRTGRAHPAMFNKIVVDYYGAFTPVNQLASFQVPEARMAIVSPYDKGSLDGHREGDPRLRPRGQPDQRRLDHPGDRSRSSPRSVARDYIKVAKHKAEEARVSIRNVRRHAKDELERLAKDGETGEDDVRRAEKELEDLTHQLRRPDRRAAQAQGSRAPRGLRWRPHPRPVRRRPGFARGPQPAAGHRRRRVARRPHPAVPAVPVGLHRAGGGGARRRRLGAVHGTDVGWHPRPSRPRAPRGDGDVRGDLRRRHRRSRGRPRPQRDRRAGVAALRRRRRLPPRRLRRPLRPRRTCRCSPASPS